MMRKLIYLLLICVLLFSCEKKEILLPQVAVEGVTGIQNHSQIWLFFESTDEEIKAELNKNNIITSTHWIINIDKRLPLSEVIPILQKIKNKRAKKTMHSVNGMMTYLSYSDTASKKIALYSIDNTQYIMQSFEDFEKLEEAKPSKHLIDFALDRIEINNRRISPDKWNHALLDTLSQGSLQLQFNSKITYQDYIKYRLSLIDKLPNDIEIKSLEYIIK